MYLTSSTIDVASLLLAARESDGAVCLFLGVVRNENEGRPTAGIQYEAYGQMAESEIAKIVRSLEREWPLTRVHVEHRVGNLRVGEVSIRRHRGGSPHRAQAFEACRAAIERIKKTVPIWKKEMHPDGSSEWVDPTKRSGRGGEWERG